jgi:hypothetical protein
MKVFGPKKIQLPCSESANLAISNLALLIPCMEFEIVLAQIPSFEVF